MLKTTYVDAKLDNGVPVCLLTTEKVGDYECTQIETDLSTIGSAHRWRLVIDFAQVKLLSSVGIGLLLKLNKLATAGKGKVIFCNFDPNIFKLLQMTKLDKGLPIAKDKASAVKTLQEL
jgi:anti-anti-sigma factor